MARIRIQSDEEVVSALKKKWESCERQRESLKIEWDACQSAYQGLQSAGLSHGLDSGQAAQLWVNPGGLNEGSHPQITGLHLTKAMLFLHSKLCISEPAVTFRAFNDDHSNAMAAKFAQTVINHVKQVKDLQEVLEAGPYLSCAQYGAGALFIGWDGEGGEEPVDVPDNFDPLKDEFTMEGDYDIHAVALDRFHVEPDAQRFSDANWCIEEIPMDLNEAIFRFPDFTTELQEYVKQPESVDIVDRPSNQVDTSTSNTVCIYSYWERGRPWNGLLGSHIYFIKKDEPIILLRENNPYAHKRLPYLLLTDIDITKSSYGMSRAVLCTPMQDAQNTFLQLLQTGIELNAIPRMTCPEGAVNEDILSNCPEKFLTYNASAGEKPDYMRPPSAAPDIWQLNKLYETQMSGIYGMGEFSQGQINRELSSFAVQMEIEVDDKFRIRLFNKKKNFISQMYEMILEITKQFVGTPRLLKVAGQENVAGQEYFSAQDLKGEYGIFADFGVYLPADPAARKQQILELLKSGALEKAGLDMKKIVSLLVDGDMLSVRDFLEISRKRQAEETVRMINGEDIPVEEWDEHTSHMQELQEYTATAEFDKLPAEVKQRLWKGHWEKHRDMLAKMQAAAQPQGAAPGGAPAPAGPAPTPGMAPAQTETLSGLTP